MVSSLRLVPWGVLLGLFCIASGTPAPSGIQGGNQPRDAFIRLLGHENNEGEAHGPVKAPPGSSYVSVPASPDSNERMPLFVTTHTPEQAKTITHAFLSIHGRLRDGDHYWSLMNKSITAAQKEDYPNARRGNILVIAPQFFSAKYNNGQYTKDQLAWDDLNAWQAAEKAVQPAGTEIDSIDALDGIVDAFTDPEKYPMIRNVTIVGHGGGAQLAQRYAALAKDEVRSVHVRYIHGDASTCVYFTTDRPSLPQAAFANFKMPTAESCPAYNDWRYGFDRYTRRARGGVERPGMGIAQESFLRYVTRDVISLIGQNDTSYAGDQTCMADMQGGEKRRDRNMIWWRYVNTLAGTDERLDGFPGAFGNVTGDGSWKELSKGGINMRLGIARGIRHNAAKLFETDTGKSALFSDGEIDIGWRPWEDDN